MKRFLYTAIVCEFCCGSVLGSLATQQNFEKPNFQKQDKVQQIYDINLKDFFETEVYKQKYQISNDCVASVVTRLIERGDIALADHGESSVALHSSAVAVLKDELYKLTYCDYLAEVVGRKVRREFDTAFSGCKDEPLQDRGFEYVLPKKNATFCEIIEDTFKELNVYLVDTDFGFYDGYGDLDWVEKWLVDIHFGVSNEIWSRLADAAESVMGRENFSKDDFFRKISDIIKKTFNTTFRTAKNNAILENLRKNLKTIFSEILYKDSALHSTLLYSLFIKTGDLLRRNFLYSYSEARLLWFQKMVMYEILNGNGSKNLASSGQLETLINILVSDGITADMCHDVIDNSKPRKLISSLIDMEKLHADMPDETKLKEIISDWSKKELLPCWWIYRVETKQKDLIFELKKIICSWNKWVDENADWIYKADFKGFMQLWVNQKSIDVQLMDNTEEYDLKNDKTKYEELYSKVDILRNKLNELTFGLRSLIFSWIGGTPNNVIDITKYTHNNEGYKFIDASINPNENPNKVVLIRTAFSIADFLEKCKLNVLKDGVEEVVPFKVALDEIRKRISALYEEQNRLYEEDLKNESKSTPESWRRIFELLVKDAWESIKEKVLEINNNACAAEK